MLFGLLSAAGTAVSVAVGVLAVGLVVFAVVYHAIRKKQGKGGCDCGCGGCSGCCSSCSPKRKTEDKK